MTNLWEVSSLAQEKKETRQERKRIRRFCCSSQSPVRLKMSEADQMKEFFTQMLEKQAEECRTERERQRKSSMIKRRRK